MRLFLIIPVFVLFMSNVPFIRTMPMHKAITVMQENEASGDQNNCGQNTGSGEETCSPAISSCEEGTEQTGLGSNTVCCQKTETTCIYIYCFQFAAPLQIIEEFQFSISPCLVQTALRDIGKLKDQYIGAPWRPPDLA